MPDFRETFSFAIDRLNEYALGCLHVMDGLADLVAYGRPFISNPGQLQEANYKTPTT